MDRISHILIFFHYPVWLYIRSFTGNWPDIRSDGGYLVIYQIQYSEIAGYPANLQFDIRESLRIYIRRRRGNWWPTFGLFIRLLCICKFFYGVAGLKGMFFTGVSGVLLFRTLLHTQNYLRTFETNDAFSGENKKLRLRSKQISKIDQNTKLTQHVRIYYWVTV